MKTKNKLFKRFLCIMLAIMLCFAASVPTILSPVQVQAATKIKLNKTSASINIGKTIQLKVTGTSKKVTWSSSNKKIATVTSKGKVKGVSKGSAYIYAKVAKKTLKCKITVKEFVYLDKTSLTLNVGDTQKLTLQGASGTVKWSSSNTYVATVSDNGTITTISEGSTYIRATYDGKNYLCNLEVRFNEETCISNLSIKYETSDNCMIARIQNNNSYDVSLETTMVYYDNNKIMIGTSEDSAYCLEKGASCALVFDYPYDSNYDTVIPASYKLNINPSSAGYKYSNVSAITTEYSMGTSGVIVCFKNTSKTTFEFIKATILMYDSNNKLLSATETYAECEKAGSEYYYTYSYPYDSNYDDIIPAYCDIVINGAYGYN